MYVAGTAGHSVDWRKSAGGFIHGFRYTGKIGTEKVVPNQKQNCLNVASDRIEPYFRHIDQ